MNMTNSNIPSLPPPMTYLRPPMLKALRKVGIVTNTQHDDKYLGSLTLYTFLHHASILPKSLALSLV